MSKLDDALKRLEQVATFGMRESDYITVTDSLGWFREDLAVVKTALSKKEELLRLYEEKSALSSFIINGNDQFETSYFKVSEKIDSLKKELGEMK